MTGTMLASGTASPFCEVFLISNVLNVKEIQDIPQIDRSKMNKREFCNVKRISSVSTILKEISHLLVVDLNHLHRNFVIDCPLSLCLKIK